MLRLVCVCLFTATLMLPSRALAHPHEFVEMKTVMQFDDQGRASGLIYDWTFDEFFSAYATEPADTDGDGKPDQKGLNELIVEIMGNITPINYFTKFDTNTVVPEFGKAVPATSEMVKRRLHLQFTVPFRKPIDLKGKAISYAVYDDEFYIAMNHSTDKNAIQIANAPEGCSYVFDPANPDEKVQEFASSLDKTESGGSDLGINFAEWVTVTCK